MPPSQAVEELGLSFAGLTTDAAVEDTTTTTTSQVTSTPVAVDWPRATAAAKSIADSLGSGEWRHNQRREMSTWLMRCRFHDRTSEITVWEHAVGLACRSATAAKSSFTTIELGDSF